MNELLKSYLVSLGFTVDMNEYNKCQGAIKELGNVVQSQTAGMAKSFSAAATAITGALSAVSAASAQMVVQVAKADMEYQKFALHMWTSLQTAKELKTVLGAMGESLEDVAWIPELRAQYGQLLNQGRSMQTPSDAAGQLKNIRSIIFEFQRMKLEAAYAMEWVSYYLIKYMGGPLNSIKDTIKGLNDKITKDMPSWTNKAAQWITMLINLGKSALKFIDAIPISIKVILAALVALKIGLLASPWTWFIAALGAALLLIDDFYGYIDGRKSSKTLAPFWDRVIKLLKEVNGVVEIFSKSFKQNNVWGSLLGLLNDIATALGNVAKGFTNIATRGASAKGFWQSFADGLSKSLNSITAFTRALVGMVDVVLYVLQGDFERAKLRGASIIPQLRQALDPDEGGNGHGTSRSWGNDINNFMESVGQKESGGNYDSPAHMDNGHWNLGGKYQILAENWSQWAREAGLSADAAYTQENQDIVAKAKMMKLFQQYGNWDLVAAEWNGGGEGANSYRKYGKDSYEAGYVSDVMNNFRNAASSAVSSFRDSYTAPSRYSGPANSSTFTTGDINIHVSSETAQKARTVEINMKDANGRVIARQVRDFAVVIG